MSLGVLEGGVPEVVASYFRFCQVMGLMGGLVRVQGMLSGGDGGIEAASEAIVVEKEGLRRQAEIRESRLISLEGVVSGLRGRVGELEAERSRLEGEVEGLRVQVEGVRREMRDAEEAFQEAASRSDANPKPKTPNPKPPPDQRVVFKQTPRYKSY